MGWSDTTRNIILVLALVILLMFINIYAGMAAAIGLLIYLNHRNHQKKAHQDFALFQQGEH